MTAPTLGHVVVKGLLELVGMLLLLLPLAYIYVFTKNFEPFHRGFFCDDENLKHPYQEQTVPILAALFLWLALAVVSILLVETLRSLALRGQRRATPIPDKKYPPWLAVELYRYFGFFTLGACGCLVFTEISKYSIGRLRPHFLTVCQPDYSRAGLCRDTSGYYSFVTDSQEVLCRGLQSNGGSFTLKQLHEARLSFLSGHSSFSFYCATFLAVYLQARLTNFPSTSHATTSDKVIYVMFRGLKVFRPFIQFGMITLAFWISLTRISDYFHHPYDVVTGAVVGILFALATILVMADVFNKRSAFWKSLLEEAAPEEAQQLNSHGHSDGHGDGHVHGHADGHGHGQGDGHGHGHSDGHGDGHGQGDGHGHGNGHGTTRSGRSVAITLM